MRRENRQLLRTSKNQLSDKCENVHRSYPTLMADFEDPEIVAVCVKKEARRRQFEYSKELDQTKAEAKAIREASREKRKAETLARNLQKQRVILELTKEASKKPYLPPKVKEAMKRSRLQVDTIPDFVLSVLMVVHHRPSRTQTTRWTPRARWLSWSVISDRLLRYSHSSSSLLFSG